MAYSTNLSRRARDSMENLRKTFKTQDTSPSPSPSSSTQKRSENNSERIKHAFHCYGTFYSDESSGSTIPNETPPVSEQPPSYTPVDWNELTTEQQQILEKLAESSHKNSTKTFRTSRLLGKFSTSKNKLTDKLRHKKNGVMTWWKEEGKNAVCTFMGTVAMFGIVVLIFVALSAVCLLVVIL